MNYIIDGYNLIGKISKISFQDPQKEEKLISFLKARLQNDKDFFHIIFDNKKHLDILGDTYSEPQFLIKFPPSDQSADDYIIEYLPKIKKQTHYTIVSSDREIINKAKEYQVKTLKSEEFLKHYRPGNTNNDQEKKDYQLNDYEFQYWLEKFS
ncbi:hypothetical protein HOC37_07980 [bacterium]|jgi:predicted RNA-binding protein with PIN domain|nr:hypothetical protein [bacterium]MBT3581902.1 hypothetical protein [bacterium]MBT4552897.1 hypothetical protein [bacterium]